MTENASRPQSQAIDDLEQLAKLYEMIDRFDSALVQHQKIGTLFPERTVQSCARHPNENPLTAVNDLRRRIKTAAGRLRTMPPEAAPPWVRQAMDDAADLVRQGDFSTAINILTTLMGGSPPSSHLLFNLACIHASGYRPARAAPLMDRLLAIERPLAVDSAKLFISFARDHHRLDQATLDKAANIAVAAVAAAPDDEELALLTLSLVQNIMGIYRNDWVADLRAKVWDMVQARAAGHPLASQRIRTVGNVLYAIGHLCTVMETSLKEMLLGWTPAYRIVVFAESWKIANRTLLNYWVKQSGNRVVTVEGDQLDDPKLASLDGLETPLCFVKTPEGNAYNLAVASSVIEKAWSEEGRPPLLTLEDEDRRYGREVLHDQFGLPMDAWFAVLYARDGGFKSEGNSAFNSHRNSDIDNFIPAIEAIVAAGGWVVRMGDPKMKPLQAMPRVIPYCHSAVKSDRLDIAIWAQARFAIGNSGGAIDIGTIFGVPTAFVDWPPAPPVYRPTAIFAPKLPIQTASGHLLPYRTVLDPPFQCMEEGARFGLLGVGFRDVEPEELREIAIEMIDRTHPAFDAATYYAAGDEADQAAWAATVSQCYPGLPAVRLARGFMRRHHALFVGA